MVDARVIALTNADLDELVKAGKFRQDLWFRLQGLSFDLRPLRDRRPDIMQLAVGRNTDAGKSPLGGGFKTLL